MRQGSPALASQFGVRLAVQMTGLKTARGGVCLGGKVMSGWLLQKQAAWENPKGMGEADKQGCDLRPAPPRTWRQGNSLAFDS